MPTRFLCRLVGVLGNSGMCLSNPHIIAKRKAGIQINMLLRIGIFFMRLQIACLLALLAGTQTSAAADATAYSGTIGKLPIIVELAPFDAEGKLIGRYSYVNKGGDIPLHGTTPAEDGKLSLQEEKPCTEKLCKSDAGDRLEIAPIGAEWNLTIENDGGTLEGTWQDKESGKSLPIKLERKAMRALTDSYQGYDSIDPTFISDTSEPPVLTPALLPYDFLKIAVPMKEGAVQTVGDSAYRLDEDPRTKLVYPYVTKLGNQDPAPLNTYLNQQRLQFELPAFSCMARSYLGSGWSGQGGEGTTGFEEGGATVSVEHLTSRLMGVVESGSYYCGGAYPDNFTDHRLVDARTGEALVPESLLRGWVATREDGTVVDPTSVEDTTGLNFGPSEELIKFVNDHRDKSDATLESDCGMSDLVRTNLGIYFTQDSMVFTLRSLPHVIFACTSDLVKVPFKDARPLLTDAGAKYFPALDR
ncbi:MAG: hypothetical protein JWM58_829 [Rhizobium sp.]|nr:hypothetical protein [Rhizobium sp.]